MEDFFKALIVEAVVHVPLASCQLFDQRNNGARSL
jgi:hypothetical protein